jgi:phage-related protein
MPIGPGSIDETWQVESPAMPQSQALPIKQSLEQLTGTEQFSWSPTGLLPSDYVCSAWRIAVAGPGYYRISGDFESFEQNRPMLGGGPVYPILPITLTWNTGHTYTARTAQNQTRFQEGVDRRERHMLNPINETIDAQVAVTFDDDAGVDSYGLINSTLRERAGRPFRLRPENRHLNAPDLLYICKEWEWQKPGYGLVWRFSGKFEQVRVLNNAPT